MSDRTFEQTDHKSRLLKSTGKDLPLASPVETYHPLASVINRFGNTGSISNDAAILQHDPSLSQYSLLQLQQQYGNQYVQRVVELAKQENGQAEVHPEVEAAIQRQPGDLLEKETDKMPQTVMGMPDLLKTNLEQISGMDLSGVRVHYNSSKPAQIDALAYTQGQEVHIGPGQEKHLPHEGWHVVQQMQGRVNPTMQAKGVSINDDIGLEREADLMGERAVLMKSKDSPSNVENIGASTTTGTPTNTGVIQRAMKFEWQISGNHLFRDTGREVQPLPRKYGPEDYIVKGKSGVRFESESRGESEFETGWEKKWSKLERQVTEAQHMAKQMTSDISAPEVTGIDGNTYKELPFSDEQLKHLTPGQGFSVSGTKWHKRQKTGKRLVSKPKENVRSSPEYIKENPTKNKIGEVTLGTKLKVVSESEDGKWIQFKSADIEGWIWKRSTKAETKRYESNKNIHGKYIDTELQAHERLLIKVDDPDWNGAFQVSESFELGQFESYLKENQNTRIETDVLSQTSALMSLPIVSGGSNGLKNFLLMVVYFIQSARRVSLLINAGTPTEKLLYAKAAFKLMSRTNFGSVYKSSNLTDRDRSIFKTLVDGTSEGILPALGLDRSTKVFVAGQAGGYNPTVYNWLDNITDGKDILSGPTGHVSGAMGKFDINKEQGKNENLVRFENRNPKDPVKPTRLQPVDEWLKFAKHWFEKAATERPRTTGKGETGLEK